MAAERRALLIGINDYPFIPSADLEGCVNDVTLLGSLLGERFDFGVVRTLVDAEATRESILRALDELERTTRPNDIAVFAYSGHGSRVLDHRTGSGRMVESIVPHDSGRGEHPNRDIIDEEIDRWVQRINHKTPFVTLIFDSCHSGSVNRDAFGERVRSVEADRRPAETMFGDDGPPEIFLSSRSRAADSEEGRNGWVAGRQNAVLVAACAASQLANQIKVPDLVRAELVQFGALSHYLCKVLATIEGGTWRDVYERVAPLVTERFKQQYPQIEGKLDEALFDIEELRAAPYLRIAAVSVDDTVTVAGGEAHGVVAGSRWSLREHGSRHRHDGAESATIRISKTGPGSSLGIVEAAAEEGQRTPVGVGQRAFLIEANLGPRRLPVALAVPAEQTQEAEVLQTAIDGSSFLQLAKEADRAEVLIRFIPPREVVGPDSPCPALGPLALWTWAAVGGDGRIAVSTRSQDESLARLVGDLESLARFRSLLALENPDPESALRHRATVEVRRWNEHRQQFEAARADSGVGAPILRQGDFCDLTVHNRADRPIWISLVEFGLDGKISLLLPRRGHPTFRLGSDVQNEAVGETSSETFGGFCLEPGESISVRDYYLQHPELAAVVAKGLNIRLPTGFPFAAEPGDEPGFGLLHIKLFATAEPASFEFLERGAHRRESEHPLAQATLAAANGNGSSTIVSQGAGDRWHNDWTTRTISLALMTGS